MAKPTGKNPSWRLWSLDWKLKCMQGFSHHGEGLWKKTLEYIGFC